MIETNGESDSGNPVQAARYDDDDDDDDVYISFVGCCQQDLFNIARSILV